MPLLLLLGLLLALLARLLHLLPFAIRPFDSQGGNADGRGILDSQFVALPAGLRVRDFPFVQFPVPFVPRLQTGHQSAGGVNRRHRGQTGAQVFLPFHAFEFSLIFRG